MTLVLFLGIFGLLLVFGGFAYASFCRNFVLSYGAWRFCSGVNVMNNLQYAINKTLPIVLTDLESAMANAKTGKEYFDLESLYLFLVEQQNTNTESK